MTTFTGPPAESEQGIGALTLGGLLAETCAAHRDLDAIAATSSDGAVTRWTYDDLEREARRWAKGLLVAGVGRGTRVGLLLPNRAEWLAAAFGIALCGGVMVPLSTFATPEELEQLLQHSGISLLLVQGGFARSPLDALAETTPGLLDGPPAPLLSARFPLLRRVFDLSGGDDRGACAPVSQLLAAGEDVPDDVLDAAAAGVTPADDAVVIYTSGTTERPKGILHAQRSPALQSWRFAARQRLVEGDRVFSAFPFFWTAGFAMVMGSTLCAGGCLVVGETFEPEAALRAIQDEKVTIVHVWPHHAAQLRDCPTNLDYDLSSVRNDSSRLRPGHKPDEAVGLGSSRAGYGMSETFTIVTSAPVDAGREITEGSHGFLLPGNAMRILDPETRELLGPGQEGELLVKGTTLMRGYLGLPPEACFDADGFFHSGDTGYIDDRGLLHWTGRATELIKTGGANVSPVELETVLARHPGLLAAAVVGLPDEILGEVVVACVAARPGYAVDEEGVRAFAREHLSSYKVPRRVLFFDRAELPTTGTDKVQHAELRALAEARVAAAAEPEPAPA
jgi:acyl-CoA synthetase (AMP-forming)/AMP-acid ligase II